MFVTASAMDEETVEQQPLIGAFDVILLAVLFGIAFWWLKDRKQKKDAASSAANAPKSYCIQ